MAVSRLLSPNQILSSSFPPTILCCLYSTSSPLLQPFKDADLLSQILLHHHNPFYSMESCLQLHGVSLSSSLLHQTLLRLSNHSKISLSLFHYALSLPSDPSLVVSSATYDLIINILSKVRQFDVSWQLIVDMESRNIQPTSNTFFILIRRLIVARLTRQAIRAFDDMECFISEKLDHSHFCFLLDTLCKYGYIKVAVEIFNKRKFQFSPNVRMYTVLIYTWCKIGRIDMAERFLREMDERGIEPNNNPNNQPEDAYSTTSHNITDLEETPALVFGVRSEYLK